MRQKLKNSIMITPSDCWEWQLGRGRRGYGHVWVKGKTKKAHRLSYEAFVGEIPNGMLVCHHCDNPPCINPKHLFLGTPQDNIRDSIRKGRFPGVIVNRKNLARGERMNTAKLTEIQIKRIRAEYLKGCLQSEISRKYGVNQQSISGIVTGKTWRHLL
jgi:hypothetical protein